VVRGAIHGAQRDEGVNAMWCASATYPKSQRTVSALIY